MEDEITTKFKKQNKRWKMQKRFMNILKFFLLFVFNEKKMTEKAKNLKM